jgi:hypothetical protein
MTTNLNYKKGIFRVFITVWVIWILFGLSYSYKQIATHYGYSKWTIEEIKKESESECEKALDKKNQINCYAHSDDYISYEKAEIDTKDFFIFFLFVPFLILISSIGFVPLIKWLIDGFKNK